MQLCESVDFPLFALAQRAYQVARSLRSHPRPLRVAILDNRGTLLASGSLQGYTQVAMFGELLRRSGFTELLPRTAQRFADCDVAFVEPSTGPDRGQHVLPQEVLDVESWADRSSTGTDSAHLA